MGKMKRMFRRFDGFLFGSVLCSGLCVFGMLDTFTLKQLFVRFTVNDLVRRAEIAIAESRWDDAAATLDEALSFDRFDDKTAVLFESVRQGYLSSGEASMRRYDYETALESYRKALKLLPDDIVARRVEDLETAVTLPRLFIADKPLRVALFANDIPLGTTFSPFEIPEKGDSIDTHAPGELLVIGIRGETIRGDVTMSLARKNGKTVSTNRAFPVPDAAGKRVLLCLLPLPSTMERGPFELGGSWSDSVGNDVSFRKEVAFRDRVFPEEVIALGQKLTNLLTRPDQRKVEDRKRVREILGTFEPGNVYCEGMFMVPVELKKGRISSFFGDRRRFVYAKGGGYSSIHDGIDYGMKKGTPVFATASGRVVLAREHLVSGNTIIIEHLPSVYSAYYHLSKIEVTEGDMVPQLYKIGEVGSTGLSTAAHLHLSVFVASIPVDPGFLFRHDPLSSPVRGE